jgi:hypothetical protein
VTTIVVAANAVTTSAAAANNPNSCELLHLASMPEIPPPQCEG